MTATKNNLAGNRTTRVLIVDDHPTLREGLAYRIDAQSDMAVCGEAADANGALAKIAEASPHVVIVDIGLKQSDGVELIHRLRSLHQQVRSLVHSMHDESVYASRCLQAGAMGFVNKEANPDEVIHAVREVAAGRIYLSPAMTEELLCRSFSITHARVDPVETLTNRQLEVFRLIGAGKSSAEIASQLHISRHTVDTHRENVKQKLGVETAAELIRQATLWDSRTRQ